MNPKGKDREGFVTGGINGKILNIISFLSKH